MHRAEFNQLKARIDTSFVVQMSRLDLAPRMSATEGFALTPEQYGQLARMDTDVIDTGERQYALADTVRGFRLCRMVRPVRTALNAMQERECATA